MVRKFLQWTGSSVTEGWLTWVHTRNTICTSSLLLRLLTDTYTYLWFGWVGSVQHVMTVLCGFYFSYSRKVDSCSTDLCLCVCVCVCVCVETLTEFTLLVFTITDEVVWSVTVAKTIADMFKNEFEEELFNFSTDWPLKAWAAYINTHRHSHVGGGSNIQMQHTHTHKNTQPRSKISNR